MGSRSPSCWNGEHLRTMITCVQCQNSIPTNRWCGFYDKVSRSHQYETSKDILALLVHLFSPSSENEKSSTKGKLLDAWLCQSTKDVLCEFQLRILLQFSSFFSHLSSMRSPFTPSYLSFYIYFQYSYLWCSFELSIWPFRIHEGVCILLYVVQHVKQIMWNPPTMIKQFRILPCP